VTPQSSLPRGASLSGHDRGLLPGYQSGPILNLDFNEWAKTYEGPLFNFVHCDFPYGINADGFNQGGAATHGGYEDTPKTYWTLVESLVANLDRLCTVDCHFMFWFSMQYSAGDVIGGYGDADGVSVWKLRQAKGRSFTLRAVQDAGGGAEEVGRDLVAVCCGLGV
jgi:hypothetical protein